MSPLLVGAALGATGALILDPQQGPRRRALVQHTIKDGRAFVDAARTDSRQRVRAIVGGVGAASILYALVRGGFGALMPLALGAGLIACAINASARRSARRA